MHQSISIAGLLLALSIISTSQADTLTLKDGTVLRDCFLRDEGVRLAVWTSIADVGKAPKMYPRTAVQDFKIERGPAWDQPPDLPDLTITHLEINPKLPSLHGLIQYTEKGTPYVALPAALPRSTPTTTAPAATAPAQPAPGSGERKLDDPNTILQSLKLRYANGEELTVTAHVRNVGFKPAAPFELQWLLDGTLIGSQKRSTGLAPMESTQFEVKVKWDEQPHQLTARIEPGEAEVAVINNELTEALGGWGLVLVVSRDRAAEWHKSRTAYGTFCLEDYFRWHLEIMNRLFEASVYPSTPQGIKPRVRLDRIVYADSVTNNTAVVGGQPFKLAAADGWRYDQGACFWNDEGGVPGSAQGNPGDPNVRLATQWPLLAHIGHQLGLVDWSKFDYAGDAAHVWPDNGQPVTHQMRQPFQLMYEPGPRLLGEVDAAFVNFTADKPRGYTGDYLFAIPRVSVILARDMNGRPLTGAKVEIFQRGAVVDPNGQSIVDETLSPVYMYPVIEDSNFSHPLSQQPTITGETNEYGTLILSRRPIELAITVSGFSRVRGPFGNIDVGGQRGLLLVKMTKDGRTDYFWIDSYDLVLPWFRGNRNDYVLPLQTTFASPDSPPPPADVKLTRPEEHQGKLAGQDEHQGKLAARDEHYVKLTWTAPRQTRPLHPSERITGYRVYRRIGNDGLNDRPWFAVATLPPDAREFVVDLRQRPENPSAPSSPGAAAASAPGAAASARGAAASAPGAATERFGVTSIAGGFVESELIGHVLPDTKR